MKHEMKMLMLATCVVLCLEGCHDSNTDNVAVCESNCKEAPMDLKIPVGGNSGWHGIKLDPEEQDSLNKAASKAPTGHVDVGVQGGKLDFQPDANPGHTSSGSSKIALQSAAGSQPKEVTLVPTPAAATAMHQRFASVQKP